MYTHMKARKTVMYSAVFVMTLLLTWTHPGDAQQLAARVNGTLFNKTLNQPGTAEKITLMRVGQGLEEEAVLENVSGTFTFENILPPSPETKYFVRALHQGVNYHVNVGFSAGLTQTVSVTLYETTPTPEQTTISIPHLIVVKQGETLKFDETVNVDNAGNRTVFSNNPNRPTFLFSVPEEVSELTRVSVTYEDNIPLNQTPVRVGNQFGINFPLRPGVTQITYTYIVDYAGDAYAFTKRLPYDLSSFIVAVSPSDMTVETTDLELSGRDDNFDMIFLKGENLKKGQNISINLSGGSDSKINQTAGDGHDHGNSQILAVPNETMSYVWVVTPLLASVLTFGLWLAFSKKAPTAPKKSKKAR